VPVLSYRLTLVPRQADSRRFVPIREVVARRQGELQVGRLGRTVDRYLWSTRVRPHKTTTYAAWAVDKPRRQTFEAAESRRVTIPVTTR